MAKERKEFMIEGAELIFKNFGGREDQYNTEGNRHFSVILTKEMADQLAKDGWNIKKKLPKNEEYDPFFMIRVAVRFDNWPPRITMLTNEGRTRTMLNEDNVEILDVLDIKNVDLICTGSEWSVNGKSGIKAYLKTMFVEINEDALERKYSKFED